MTLAGMRTSTGGHADEHGRARARGADEQMSIGGRA